MSNLVLQLPVSCLPWLTGGKEVYTHTMSRALRGLGWDARIVVHQDRADPAGEAVREGVPIIVLPAQPPAPRSAVYACEPTAVPGFEELLDRLRPAIVHFHDFSVGANLLHMRLARQYGARLLMTYHSPGQSCLQRELLYKAQTPCDGEIQLTRCTRCRLTQSGVPGPLAALAARLPASFLDPDSANSLIRVLTGRAMTARFQAAWREVIDLLDLVQVHADWTADVMLRNGVPPRKLVRIRTGFPGALPQPATPRPDPAIPRSADDRLRLAFVGRCDQIKGIHVLIDAVLSLPRDFPVQVSFYGPYWTGRHGEHLQKRIAGDPRFAAPRLVPHSEIIEVLGQSDACVVPSTCLETGPLVVLEAFAAGIPVIGSRLGGIAELVRDGVDGILFPAGDSRALAAIIRSLAGDTSRLAALARAVQPPRTMTQVAAEIAAVYQQLLGPDADNSPRMNTDEHG